MDENLENKNEPENQGKEHSRKEEKKFNKISELQKQLNESKADCEKLVSTITDLDAKYKEVSDKYLRTLAEYDNYRKRSVKEKEDAYSSAYGEALNEFLPMIDNLERSLQYGTSDKVVDGVKLILSQFNQMLEKLGIESFGKEGDIFDPNLHNAVFHVEDENLGEGVITEVFMKGYKRGEKILRYAMVKVAN